MSQERNQLAHGMDRIRSKRIGRTIELQNEVERLADWREHVRSAPVAAFIGSIVIGAMGVRSVVTTMEKTRLASANSVAPTFQVAANATRQASAGKKPGARVIDTIVSVLLPIAARAVQQQVVKALLTATERRVSEINPNGKP